MTQNGAFTTNLIAVFQEIFSRYENNGVGLTQIEASRLWYQCGLKLSSLNEFIDDILGGDRCTNRTKKITFENFRQLLQRIITDDEKVYHLPEDENESMNFKVRVSDGIDIAKMM